MTGNAFVCPHANPAPVMMSMFSAMSAGKWLKEWFIGGAVDEFTGEKEPPRILFGRHERWALRVKDAEFKRFVKVSSELSRQAHLQETSERTHRAMTLGAQLRSGEFSDAAELAGIIGRDNVEMMLQATGINMFGTPQLEEFLKLFTPYSLLEGLNKVAPSYDVHMTAKLLKHCRIALDADALFSSKFIFDSRKDPEDLAVLLFELLKTGQPFFSQVKDVILTIPSESWWMRRARLTESGKYMADEKLKRYYENFRSVTGQILTSEIPKLNESGDGKLTIIDLRGKDRDTQVEAARKILYDDEDVPKVFLVFTQASEGWQPFSGAIKAFREGDNKRIPQHISIIDVMFEYDGDPTGSIANTPLQRVFPFWADPSQLEIFLHTEENRGWS